MNAEQIQEARKICDKATSIFPGNGEDDALRNLFIISTLLPAALDEIEAQQKENDRLRNGIEKIWEYQADDTVSICAMIDCLHTSCGSPECKKAFMEHYLGGDKVG